MKEEQESNAERGVFALTGIVFYALHPIWEGFVITKLWAWFIVTRFAQAPLSIPTAIGISLLSGILTHQRAQPKQEESAAARLANDLGYLGLGPALYLLFGFIAKSFL